MAQKKTASASKPKKVVETPAEAPIESPSRREGLLSNPWIGLVVLVVVVVGVWGAFNLAYSGRILPGVSADGLYVGGLTVAQADQNLQVATAAYVSKPLVVKYGQTALTTTPAAAGVDYQPSSAAKLALNYGHQGNIFTQLHQQLRALLHRSTLVSSYQYDNSKLAGLMGQLRDAVAVPVQNAALGATAGAASVTPAQDGTQLNLGLFIMSLNTHVADMKTTTLVAPLQTIASTISTPSLQSVAAKANNYVAAPITLKLSNGATQTITPTQIAGWIQAQRPLAPLGSIQATLSSLYGYAAASEAPVTVGLNSAAVAQYVSTLAAKTDSAAVNAELSIANGNQVSVFVPSSNGYQLDQAQAISAITQAVAANGSARTVSVNVKTLTPAVSEANLNSLGINQLISEGETTFPEGPADRLQNIRTGASRFNDVLLAPGQQFSFNTILGPVDTAHGFDAALVIANGTVTTADGGGLCQVSTTMYRAALLAGLPIDSRTNHSFVVSYYTSFATTNLFGPNAGQSYSADIPGLDATIYLPDPDLKFTNDTGHYILIQEVLGYGYLKFDFYGTATKYGVIRGPYWTSASHDTENDNTQTVFYRDVYDMSGNLQHTDTVTTNYLPAAQFGE